jgi:mannose-6-phosphate isomerase-like protein (cupin superfamily)
MTVATILRLIEANKAALLRADCSGIPAPPFAGCTAHRSPSGSTVMAVALDEATLAGLPESHQWLDLFLLEPFSRVGTHYHRRATAHTYIIAGHGTVEVDGQGVEFGPGDTALFPAGARHDVISREEPVLFASFQDNPIIQPDGSLDYFADPQ